MLHTSANKLLLVLYSATSKLTDRQKKHTERNLYFNNDDIFCIFPQS